MKKVDFKGKRIFFVKISNNDEDKYKFIIKFKRNRLKEKIEEFRNRIKERKQQKKIIVVKKEEA